MAKFTWVWLVGKRQFRSLAGVEAETFREMVERLRPHWRERVVDVKNRSGRPWGVGGIEDHLLVLLIVYRCAVTQEFMGCLYGADKATISRSLRRIEALAARVLGIKRAIRVSRAEAEALIIDCTEQPVQRPRRKQRCWYSGKKKRHTIKTEIAVTERGRIVGVSKPAPGRVHDLEIRRRGPPLPKDARVYADSGYQGLQEDHAATEIPYKRSRTRPLAKDERDYNHALSRFRVRVEHRIARLKSFRILAEKYRYPRHRYGVKISTVAGIVNLADGF
jgi:IS5 family transposase